MAELRAEPLIRFIVTDLVLTSTIAAHRLSLCGLEILLAKSKLFILTHLGMEKIEHFRWLSEYFVVLIDGI